MARQADRSNSPFVIAQSHSESQMMVRSGPLPSPEDFAAYNQGHPEAAGRILTMTELQAAHRRDLEKLVISANISREARGQHYAAGAFAIVALGGFVLIGPILNPLKKPSQHLS
jgi:uncharacterized membrane protein